MREDFVDPLPELNTSATLIIGKQKIKCFVVDASVDEFHVAVPGAQLYEGDPRMMLVAGDSIYPVRLTLQEAHAGGYSYRLTRLATGEANARGIFGGLISRRIAWSCVAAGMPLAMVGAFWFVSTGDLQLQLMSLRSLRRESIGWSPVSHDNDRVPPGISVDHGLLTHKSGHTEKQHLHRVDAQDESDAELKTVSVSLVSPASLTTPALLPEAHSTTVQPNVLKEESPTSSVRANHKKMPTLASLLDEGRIGRQRTVTPQLLPWLCGSTPANQLGYLKISDAACSDLQQFESGLRGLPMETSLEAINSLRQALKRSSSMNHAKTVYGFDDIFVIRSDDASVYFRSRKGMVEIVRVLPIDFNKSE